MSVLQKEIQRKIDQKTKPQGALGKLEQLAMHVSLAQGTVSPSLQSPHMLVFAGDHGLAEEGVSAFPKAVTHQMVLNFLGGGAAINVFCRQHGIALTVVDAGVEFDFDEYDANFLNHKARKSTRNAAREKAMTPEEYAFCFEKSKELIKSIASKGTNVVGFGEMGIGNTSASALILHRLSGIDLAQCVGRGTGLDDAGLGQKLAVLQRVNDLYPEELSVEQVLQTFGGFEMVQIAAGMLAAVEKDMLILVDGFIASVSFLAAYQLNKGIMKNAIFTHRSKEKGHQLLLDHLQVEPILDLDMRLGEGTGCAVAYPIVQSAVHFLNEMASFEEAGVDEKS